jgi:hypothetical protein
MRALRFLPLVTMAMLFACGGDEFTVSEGGSGSLTSGAGGDPGSGGSSGTTSHAGNGGNAGTADAGRIKNSGDCDNAAECGGDPCVDISSGGYRACVTKVPEAMACSNPPGECCKTADCTAAGKPGKCLLGPRAPSCGGPVQVPTNICAADQCMTAADCSGSNAICVPAGVFGRKVASCLTGGCRRDSDCNEASGGACLPITGTCCPSPIGLFCVYKDGCTNDADCPDGHCDVGTGKAVCRPGPVACLAAL